MPIDFVLALHSHLPWVLNHGRWPHGSDWLCEAALDAYLPLIERLRALEAERIAAPLTLGVTPVLANQLVSPTFIGEMEAFFGQRLLACDEARESLESTGEGHLLPLVEFWRERLTRLRAAFHDIGGDIVSALRALEESGRIEIITSAATHGFLPLFARDESIRLQLALGRAEHRRLFGRAPQGIWVPECAYRPRGPWQPWSSAPRPGIRRGIEEHLGDAGFRYFFVDSHLASAGRPLGIYGDAGGDPTVHRSGDRLNELGLRSPYRAYEVAPWRSDGVAALVRDPRSSMQVWSRFQGYPGDGHYLEFHKMRWPGGLKFWRVTGGGVDLGGKEPYDPAAARARALHHAEHFTGLVAGIASSERRRRDAVVVAPFDTELFGHWWFEGPDWLAGVYRSLARDERSVRPVTASRHLADHPARQPIALPAGSWGANGDFSMWIGEATVWTWERLWAMEEAFWNAVPGALDRPAARPVLAQAARELLLAQASDWQFIISTGVAADYAERRFLRHCDDAGDLLAALIPGAETRLPSAQANAERLHRRDDLFPDILSAVANAIG
ncbi:MAG TPA: 1,4-alpha-glucan branching protein domain-containing protein [Gemmatimonadales bacterium]